MVARAQPTTLADRLAAPLVRFLAIEAASTILLLVATAAALLWVNSPWGGSYARLWHTPLSLLARGREPLALARGGGERRPDGDLLLPVGPRDQARARPRRALVARAREAPGLRRARRHGRAGVALREPARRRARRLGLGRADGDGHRLRRGGARRLRPARPAGPQGLPARTRDRRRPRRRRGDRALLRPRDLARRARRGRGRRRPGRRDAARGAALRSRLPRGGARGLARDAPLRRACHGGGRAPGAPRAARAAHAGAAPVDGLPGAADLRARQCGRP